MSEALFALLAVGLVQEHEKTEIGAASRKASGFPEAPRTGELGSQQVPPLFTGAPRQQASQVFVQKQLRAEDASQQYAGAVYETLPTGQVKATAPSGQVTIEPLPAPAPATLPLGSTLLPPSALPPSLSTIQQAAMQQQKDVIVAYELDITGSWAAGATDEYGNPLTGSAGFSQDYPSLSAAQAAAAPAGSTLLRATPQGGARAAIVVSSYKIYEVHSLSQPTLVASG